jgi:hypothetical protein
MGESGGMTIDRCRKSSPPQNIRRGHYELGVDTPPRRRVADAFTELARTV